MLQKIKILTDNVINKIAAGEVVQRPSSALKELLENSIDAKATNIEIEIKDGGKLLLIVRDNGIGMNHDDIKISYYRHSTSKINYFEDLQNINSFGFRGEALASIASVSQFEIKSRTKDNEAGYLVKINGGKIEKEELISHPVGTTVIVKNLFFNTPARKEFLKTNSTEFRSCFDVISQIALSHPEISFKFTSNDEILLNVKNEDLPCRIESIFGNNILNTLLPIDETFDNLKIYGFVGKPEFAKRAKKEQFIFVNKRFIISQAIQHAVYNGYEHLIEKGSYPFFVLNLEINGKNIDVNIHPSKLNIKFSDDSFIYRAVLNSVRKSLGKTNLTPSFVKNAEVNNYLNPISFASLNASINFENLKTQNPIVNQSFNRVENTNVNTNLNIKYLGTIENKYLVFQNEEGILIMDQHVAHERILYEKYSEYFKTSNSVSQQLLFPITKKISASDYSILKEIKNSLNDLGFQLKYFGTNTIVIESIPTEIKTGKEENILQEVIDEFKKNSQSDKIDIKDNLAKSLACKAAVKAGDVLSQNEIEKLITELFKAKMPFVCPHGRPVIFKITTNDLDKKFLRI